MVVVGVPNDLHCAVTLDAAAAGKHVVMEKPLCLNLAEADRMIAACRAGRRSSSCTPRSCASRPSTCA